MKRGPKSMGSGVSMHMEHTAPGQRKSNAYDREVGVGWLKLLDKRTPAKMAAISWRASARLRKRPITLATTPFNHRDDAQ